MSESLFRPLQRHELDIILGWAAAEGWNPGLHDAEAFWAADPEAFVGIEREGELIGSGAIVSYEGQMGFMGLFIVKPRWRGQGLGRKFWYYRRDKLRSRLQPGASISMDGVFAMQSFYGQGGFVFTHRNLRMEGRGVVGGSRHPKLCDLRSVPFSEVERYDLKHFLAPRRAFLEKWILTGGLALGYLEGERLAGYGVIRPCQTGYKIGPLFAGTSEVAEALFGALSARAVGEPLFLDAPENNPGAVALAVRHGMKECFGCARMVLGQVPPIPWNSIYGVTTFELG